ncbi:hypothetical protein TRVA0_034S00980 [Trichomonascus vanleenenianus]|uniref:uncharacterized protein n=1 Tax=Trichomonascus vanleenenianus TaxID=2268995 RepID=UPI003EC9633E
MPRPRRRRPSVQQYLSLSRDARLDVRAIQRTFEGAYLRTALSQLSFALVVLKLFNRRFIPIGTTFTVYGLLIIFIALYRRTADTKIVLSSDHSHKFATGGDTVLLLGLTSIVSYIVLIVLLVRLDK